MAKVSVILPAAGAGRRFGGDRNKIFELLDGRAVFLRALDLFVSRTDVCQIQMLVSPDDVEDIRNRFGPLLAEMNVALTPGGAQRTDSVRNALARVSWQADLICVHDAVRPCVAEAWIDATFQAAERFGAAILAYPVHGTLKKVAGDIIKATADRTDLWEAQTPQVFARDLLMEAYRTGGATDDAAMVEKIGRPVHVVTGDPRNIKITTPDDLILAEAVWPTIRRG